MSQPAFRLKRGDTAPIFEGTLKDALGDPIGLTAGDTVEFFMRFAVTNRTLVINAGPMTIVAPGVPITDPDRGKVTYAWVGGDTDEPGKMEASVRVTFSTGEIETFPNVGFHSVYIEPGIV